MTDISATLRPIAEQFSILTQKLRNNTDPEIRRALLRQFRVLLADADKIILQEDSYGQNPHANSTDHGRTLPRT
jgi:hypothetical protein